MPRLNPHHTLIQAVVIVIMLFAPMTLALADVFINVMAVNGSPERKETPVSFNLPGDLKAEDILDTDGLQLDYNVNDANYFVHGTVNLDTKESKTFRIRVKDIWKMSPEQLTQMKQEIEKGYEQVGKLQQDPKKAEALKEQLLSKLDYIVQQQSGAQTVEQRMDAYRTYRKETQRLQDKALAVDYWRSEPGKEPEERIIRFKIEVTNPEPNPTKTIKEKHYLPAEVKASEVVEAEGFEIRFDEQKQQSFLYKEAEIATGEKKVYTIGIRDTWFIEQKDIDYLRTRADYAYDFLKNSKFDQSSKFLYDHVQLLLTDIENAQKQTLPIKEHISAFRVNQRTLEEARVDVENMEKLLSVRREDLEKSKVQNVLQKVRSLNGVAGVAKQVFDKKPTPSTAWSFIGWTLIFVAFLTTINFLVWVLRSKDKKKNAEALPAADSAKAEPQAKK